MMMPYLSWNKFSTLSGSGINHTFQQILELVQNTHHSLYTLTKRIHNLYKTYKAMELVSKIPGTNPEPI